MVCSQTSIDVDVYEKAKISASLVDKAQTQAILFIIISLLIYNGFLLIYALLFVIINNVSKYDAIPGLILFSTLFLFNVFMLGVALLAKRGVSQRKFKTNIYLSITLSIFIFSMFIVIFYYIGIDGIKEYFKWMYNFCIIMLSHSWTIFLIFASAIYYRITSGYYLNPIKSDSWQALWKIGDKGLLYTRDIPEETTLGGRFLASSFGIPRITDFVSHGRTLIVILFFASTYFDGMQSAVILLPIVLLFYTMFKIGFVCNGFNNLDCGHAVASEIGMKGAVFVIFLSFIVYLISGFVSKWLRQKSEQKVRFSIRELSKVDSRRPVLFLRPFKDDQVELMDVDLSHERLGTKWTARIGGWLDNIRNLDRLLLEEATPYGPVVAIGKPGDPWPPYGAARQYFDGKTWQQAVTDLAQNAIAIILCVDDAEGVWWEVMHVAARFPEKTLLFIHPRYKNPQDNEFLAGKLAEHLRNAGAPDLARGDNPAHPTAMIGMFLNDDGTRVEMHSSTFSRLASLMAVRIFFRSKWGLPPGNR